MQMQYKSNFSPNFLQKIIQIPPKIFCLTKFERMDLST